MAISLNSIKRSGTPRPPTIMVYGVHGIGKTSLAASAPNPVFLQTEDGLGTIESDTFGILKSYSDIMDAVGALYNEDHNFKTVVLDSADWTEPLIHAETCSIHGWKSIDDGSKETSYGKGYTAALDVWRILIEGLSVLRDEKGMSVFILAHSEIKKFESPESDAYDRYQPKLQKSASDILQEAMEGVLFANYRTLTKTSEAGFNKKITRGIGTGERILYTVERPAFKAKNRWSLPDSIPMDWDALSECIPYFSKITTKLVAAE